MKHKKRNHKEKVTLCWKFESGICDFDDSSCWFIHCLNRKEDLKKLKCQSCEKEFKTLSDCLKHKKQEHTNLVSFCKNETEGKNETKEAVINTQKALTDRVYDNATKQRGWDN